MLESRRDLTIVHATGPRGDWATAGRRILTRHSESEDWHTVADFPRTGADWLSIGRLPKRLFRLDKANLWPTASGRLLGLRGGWAYRFDPRRDGAEGADPVALFEIRGDCVMNRAIAEDADGNLYFGEYFMNPERIPVRILCVDADLEHWRVAYEFDQPRIRHVHAIHADPFDASRLWITMGDFAGECFIAYTDDRFSTVHFIGDGDQLWRSVGLIFKPDEIAWLTDTHIAQNHVVSMPRDSTTPAIHGERDASSWYMARTEDGLYLATTTVEPGPGIHTDKSRLLASRDAAHWVEVAEFQKDRYPMRLGFGSLALPAGALRASGFWLSGEGLVGLDGGSLYCAIEWEP